MSNKSACATGKRVFETEEIAKEALIQHHVFNNYLAGEGPRNIYVCGDCGNWHFTSKGPSHALFEDDGAIKRMKRERIANQWERKLK